MTKTRTNLGFVYMLKYFTFTKQIIVSKKLLKMLIEVSVTLELRYRWFSF